MTPGLAPGWPNPPSPRQAELVPQGHQHLRRGGLRLGQLASMSVSSVVPVFSITAAVGPMIEVRGYGVASGMWLAFLPFLASAFTVRHLNRHRPNSGAS